MSREPSADWRTHLSSMIDDIGRIQSFIGDLDRDGFVRDEKTVFAVSYAFVRLGEAAMHIPEHVKAANADVPWRSVRHFRNFMTHVYLAVDPARLYDTAKVDLPKLLAQLNEIDASLEKE